MESFAHSSSLKKKRKKRTIDDFVIFNQEQFSSFPCHLSQSHIIFLHHGERKRSIALCFPRRIAPIFSLSLSLSQSSISYSRDRRLFPISIRRHVNSSFFFYSSSSVLFFESLSSYGSEKMEIKSRLWKWERDIGLLDDRSRYPFPRIRLLSMTRHDCFPSIPDLLFSPGPKCT